MMEIAKHLKLYHIITNYLPKGAALAAALLLFNACDKAEDYYIPTRAVALANAKQQLGVDIAADHNWVMTARAQASVTVNQDRDEAYTVKIYANDPLAEGIGYVLTQGTVRSGQAFSAFFEYPSANTQLTVGLTDSKGATVYKKAPIADGKLVTSISPGEGTKGSRPTVKERPAVWSYAFEDTPLGDYDLNDVVIKVSHHFNESMKTIDDSKLDITLCCTGASFDILLRLNDKQLFSNSEVHDILGRSHGTFVNTVIGSTNNINTVKKVTIEKPLGFSFQGADFWIKPSAASEVHMAEVGADPHAIAIPADWAWPTEFTKITDAYPHFAGFAANPSQNQDWYKYPTNVEGKIYR